MKPPDERPDTVVWFLSMLRAGKLTAAETVPATKAAAPAITLSNLNLIELSPVGVRAKRTLPPCIRGFLKRTDQKEGRPPLWKTSIAYCESERSFRTA